MRSDEELMAAYVGGEAAALDELFQRYAPVLLRVLGRGLRGRTEAQDLVQQTFLQLHRARFDFKQGARVRPWLFTIGMNLKREHFRRVQRRPEATLELDGRSDPSADAPDHARLEARQAIELALSRLPQDQAEVIALHWLEGLPFPEVAQVVGASLSAVKVRAHRGYGAMRAILSPAGNPEPPGDIEE